MIRRTAFALVLSMVPAAAMAEGTMPQMDFQNPLTTAQLLWMVVILVVLYFTLSRWGLPQIGSVLERREKQIANDLAAAHTAKAEADRAVAELNATMKQAREKAQADIAKAEADAKAKAFADAKVLNDKLDAQLEYSEKQIAEARATALAAIKPVAADVATTLITRLTGKIPDQAVLAPEIEAAFLARKVA
ncbi:MAG: F0F1 ATP synthase subunit B [Acidocella sp.]|nr:F0F1 ATP synthase subunit B [Acidocella sp.]